MVIVVGCCLLLAIIIVVCCQARSSLLYVWLLGCWRCLLLLFGRVVRFLFGGVCLLLFGFFRCVVVFDMCVDVVVVVRCWCFLLVCVVDVSFFVVGVVWCC